MFTVNTLLTFENLEKNFPSIINYIWSNKPKSREMLNVLAEYTITMETKKVFKTGSDRLERWLSELKMLALQA